MIPIIVAALGRAWKEDWIIGRIEIFPTIAKVRLASILRRVL